MSYRAWDRTDTLRARTPERDEWADAYAELIRRKGPANADTKPKETFRRALAAMIERYPGRRYYGWELCAALGVAGGVLYPVVHRMESYGLVERVHERPHAGNVGRPLRIYFALTDEGRELAAYALAAERS